MEDRPRRKPRVDYLELSQGPAIDSHPPPPHKKECWSTRTHYSLTVTDTKLQDGVLFEKVHYTGWHSKYDEWRKASDVVDIPSEFIQTSDESRRLFFTNLGINVKEALHCQRKSDSLVEIKLQIPLELFEELKEFGTLKKQRGISWYKLKTLSSLAVFLGPTWNYRIVNAQGDFAYVARGIVNFRLGERQPLMEYTSEGSPKLTHRGYVFTMKFVRGLGNKLAFQTCTDIM